MTHTEIYDEIRKVIEERKAKGEWPKTATHGEPALHVSNGQIVLTLGGSYHWRYDEAGLDARGSSCSVSVHAELPLAVLLEEDCSHIPDLLLLDLLDEVKAVEWSPSDLYLAGGEVKPDKAMLTGPRETEEELTQRWARENERHQARQKKYQFQEKGGPTRAVASPACSLLNDCLDPIMCPCGTQPTTPEARTPELEGAEMAQRVARARVIGDKIDELENDRIFCDMASMHGPIEDRMRWRQMADRCLAERQELRSQLVSLYSYTSPETEHGPTCVSENSSGCGVLGGRARPSGRGPRGPTQGAMLPGQHLPSGSDRAVR